MKLAFSTLGCPDWTWDEIFAFAKDLGYDGVEIRGVGKELYAPRIPALRPTRTARTQQELNRMGLTIPALTSACELHKKDEREDTLFAAKEYIDLASDLGTPYIRLLGDTHPAPGDNVDDGFVAEQAQELGAYAAGKSVTLLIESNGVYADTARLNKLLLAVNSPAVAALWDINHPVRYFSESVDQTLGNIGPFVRHVHIKDSVEENGVVRYRVTGQGTLPVAECARALVAAGYDGFFSLEWVKRWDLSLEEPGISFALFSQFMRSLQ